MADVIAALVTILTAELDPAADGVFGVELPETAVARMPIRALLIQPAGGVSLTAGSDADVETLRIDLKAFAATPFEANELRRRAARILRRIRRRVEGGVLVHWADTAGGFFAARERDGLWPQSFQSFQVFYSEEVI